MGRTVILETQSLILLGEVPQRRNTHPKRTEARRAKVRHPCQ